MNMSEVLYKHEGEVIKAKKIYYRFWWEGKGM